MSTYARLAELPLEIESYELEGLEREVSSDFMRLTTLIRLRGKGHEGVGEDVTYTALDQIAFQDAGRALPLTGAHDIESFSRVVERLDLWSAPPEIEASSLYRRWAFESAALDLALRQAGRSLPEVLEREPRRLTFVVSLRLGDPPSTEPLRRRLEAYPDLRFKLDATPAWDDRLIADLVDTGAVDTIDFKGAYKGTSVDQPGDPDLYARVATAFPDAWLEDPDLNPDTDAVLAEHRDRVTWDVPIHSVADIEALPFPPRMVNLKPSRLGPLRELCAAYDFCAQHGIGAYGGGQFELGPGRGQIQALATLFHPDAPNDVAPGGYNDVDPPAGLPRSPLEPRLLTTGFGWSDDG
jgi:L-alanine-DL-glutamate epimerase-like enolase superfamily enzyme